MQRVIRIYIREGVESLDLFFKKKFFSYVREVGRWGVEGPVEEDQPRRPLTMEDSRGGRETLPPDPEGTRPGGR